jgi:hypothetical protein
MLKRNLPKNQSISHSLTYSKKKYFQGLKQYKEQPIKVVLFHEDKEKTNDFSPIKSIFNKSNTGIVSTILSFLEYKEIISLKSINKYFHKLLSNKKILREYALKGGMSPENRLIFYETQINIKELKQNLLKELSKYNINSNIYKDILVLANEFRNKDKKFSYVTEQINRDITRTFYNEKFKTGNGKEMLKNILMAMAFIKPEIGYCQGMNFIVGSLINFIDNEEKCFWIFLYFIDNIDLKSLYLQNMPDYLIKLYQLNYYIKDNFPKLLPHLKINQISPDIFFSKWILTIFSNFLPFEILYNVWDLFILDKWKAIFKFSIILVHYMQDDLMNLDLYSFSPYVRNNANINLLNFSDLSKYYNDYKVTNKKLLELRDDFFVEDLKNKLEIKDSEWGNGQNHYVTNCQSELNNFKNNLKRPIEQLQQQISKLNIECEQKFKKYEKKLAQVNEIRAKLEQEIEIKTEYEKSLKNYMPEIPTDAGIEENNNIYSISNKKNGIKGEKALSPFNKNYRKAETQKIKKAESTKKRKIKFSFNLKHIIKIESNEYDKIAKKLNAINKEIDKNNKTLMIQCQKLDKKQISYEKLAYKRDELKKQLDIILQTSELTKRELIKNLSYQLKSSSPHKYNLI